MVRFSFLSVLIPVGAGAACTGDGDATTDWLVAGCEGPSTFEVTDDGSNFVLRNDIVERTFSVENGILATRGLSMLGKQYLWGTSPETYFEVNGVDVVVGGEPAQDDDVRPRFTYGRYRSSPDNVKAGGFHFVPGVRGSRPHVLWPPRGMHVEFEHVLACDMVEAGDEGQLTLTVMYELYDGTSGFSKRLRLEHTCSEPLYVFNMTVSVLKIADRTVTFSTDASVAVAAIEDDAHVNRFTNVAPGKLYGYGPGLSNFVAGEVFESFLSAEVMHGAKFQASGPQRGMTRYGLESSRFFRTVTPQIEQSPIVLQAVCVGGQHGVPPDGVKGSENYWCYDEDGTEGLENLIEQAGSVGAEMLVLGQNMNSTWRSFVGVEFQSAANKTWFKGLVDKARARGVEMGSYQLLLNARSAIALNQCAPGDATGKSGWDTLDFASGKSCHNHPNCKGGPGCCSLCGATDFYDDMRESMLDFWEETGMTVIEQDGSEIAAPCANESHSGHHGLNDSIWTQYLSVRNTYHDYLNRPDGSVGYVFGMPGSFLEAGQSKLPGGYDEMTFSLPRWTWINRLRQQIIASDFNFDMHRSNALRYFPLPISAPYHSVEASPDGSRFVATKGYNSASTISPLEEHIVEYDFALSTIFGTGVSGELRVTSLWDGPRSHHSVKKWFRWFKTYRTLLSTEFLTLAHGTTCGTGSSKASTTCDLTGFDAVLHRAPPGLYPGLKERAMVVVWNPTEGTRTERLEVPLYYAGYSQSAGTTQVIVDEMPGDDYYTTQTLDVQSDDSVVMDVTVNARGITWFVIRDAVIIV